jgi:Big-like domain-containing protein/VCBS repeat protein
LSRIFLNSRCPLPNLSEVPGSAIDQTEEKTVRYSRLLVFFFFFALGASSRAQTSFAPAVTHNSGGRSGYSVVIADVNGDGEPDLVVVNECAIGVSNCATGTVGVLLGNGDGTFQTAIPYGSGGYDSASVAVADVNGDGKPDIVVTNYCVGLIYCGYGTVGVLLGNGDGTFQTAVLADLGGYGADSIAVADVNGDGKPDLVVGNDCAVGVSCGAVGVLLGNGDGTFQTAIPYGSGGYGVVSVAVADLNGDGKPDIVVHNNCAIGVSNCATASVGVLLGNGNGTFQTAVPYGTGGFYSEYLAPMSVAVADVNGDGKPDIVVANYCSNANNCATASVGVLLGNGDGTFQTAVPYDSGGYGAVSVSVADVNGDGKPDLVVAKQCDKNNCATGAVGVLLGNGDGTFQTPVFYSSGESGATSTAVADVNGFGRPDIVVSNLGGSGVGSAVGVLIQKVATKTLLSSSLNPSLIGQSVTFTATVNPPLGGTPTGTVQFKSQPGSVLLATAPLNDSTASFTTQFSTAGSHFIIAVYSGDANCLSSISTSVLQKVNEFPTSTVVTSNLNPSNFAQSVTFTAMVTSSYGTPTGTITFRRGTTSLGTIAVSGNTASFSTSALSAGTNSINAVYSGDANFATSTSPNLNQKVNKMASTTTLFSSANPSTSGQSVTFTATVTAISDTPTGTVTFKNGAAKLGTGTLSGGTATFTTTALPSGTDAITAVYGGDTNDLGSTSPKFSQVVQ